MATNHLVESTAQVTVEGLVIGDMEKEGERELAENMEDEEEEEVEEEVQQEDSMEKEKERVKKRKKNTQNKPLVLDERVRKLSLSSKGWSSRPKTIKIKVHKLSSKASTQY